jgi:hypothetical protein
MEFARTRGPLNSKRQLECPSRSAFDTGKKIPKIVESEGKTKPNLPTITEGSIVTANIHQTNRLDCPVYDSLHQYAAEYNLRCTACQWISQQQSD